MRIALSALRCPAIVTPAIVTPAMLSLVVALTGCAAPSAKPAHAGVTVEVADPAANPRLRVPGRIVVSAGGGAASATAALEAQTAREAKAKAAVKTNIALLAGPAKKPSPAPARFMVEFDTTQGPFRVQLVRAWAPHGVDRFYELVKAGYFADIAFFRVIPGFMAQFGIHGVPAVSQVWRQTPISDDVVNPTVASNQRGYLTFAMAGPNTRTTQLFISFRNNSNLDKTGFAPIGVVIGGGMTVVSQLYSGYGEGAPRGRGPNQALVQSDGNAYLRRSFPKLDYIRRATLVR